MKTIAPSGRLVDWVAAASIAKRVAGTGPPLSSLDRARLLEDFAEIVPEAEALVSQFTGLRGRDRARPWVMTRAEWIEQNIRAFRRLIDPLAERLLSRGDTLLAPLRRQALGVQVGLLLGYLSKKVLGQYDLFLPPDDQGLIYFVGPNVVTVERRFRFEPRDFRMWLALHEVDHELQFGGVAWLRGHLTSLVDGYLNSIELDPKQLVEALRRAVREIRSGRGEWKGIGIVFLLLTPEQRDLFRRMQAVMSLLEGHGNYVMDTVSAGRVHDADRMRRTLKERRRSRGWERAFQKAMGFDAKVRQYDVGERFVAQVVERAGPEAFGRVWDDPANVPTLEEINQPDRWIERVGAS